MYIVINKKNRSILHINPAPLSQALAKEEVYHSFDSATMKIVKTDNPNIPDFFDISKDGYLIEPTMQKQFEHGLFSLPNNKKLEGDRIRDKTLEELSKEGLLHIAPSQKISQDHVLEKTVQEKLEDGQISISPDQEIVNNQIVYKSLEKQISEGVIIIDEPFQYIDDNQIKSRTVKEILEQNFKLTEIQCKKALAELDRDIENRIFEKYPISYELKITKEYLNWLSSKKPKKDPREERYLKMQKEIEDIKAEYFHMRKKLEKHLDDVK